MNIHSWKDTWGTISWRLDPASSIKEKIKDFYKAGVDFNMEDDTYDDGKTVLFRAVADASVDIVEYLIDGGADVNQRCNDDSTVLHLAARGGLVDMVKCLIKHGPKKCEEKENCFGSTALHVAANEGKTEVVKVLLDHNPDLIDKKNKSGKTAVDLAISWDNVNTARVLIERGADVSKIQINESTPSRTRYLIENANQIREDYLEKKSVDIEPKEVENPVKVEPSQPAEVEPVQPVKVEAKKTSVLSKIGKFFTRQR